VRLLPAALVVIAAAAWAGMVGSAPLLLSPASDDRAVFAAAWVYRAGSILCHQQTGRSLAIHGVQLPVCARCAGLYAGGAAGAALAWLGLFAAWRRGAGPHLSIDRWRVAAVVSGLPLLVAWTGEHGLGVSVSNLGRFTTALPLGASVAAIVVFWAGSVPFHDSPPATAIH
jgi:hypothetical protein